MRTAEKIPLQDIRQVAGEEENAFLVTLKCHS